MYKRTFESGFESCLQAPESSLLYVMWAMACTGREMPREHELPLRRLGYMRDNLMVLRPVGEDWTYEHYGRTVAQHAGFDMTGKRVSDFKGELGKFYAEIYARIRRDRRPLATIHRYGAFGERPMWERMIVPLGGPDTIDCLYVVNKVRELDRDISHVTARARNRGLIVLQFQRDEQGNITDAVIVGANRRAQEITNRRLDELNGNTMLSVFPGLRDAGLWDRYLLVGATQQPEVVDVTYDSDGVTGAFRVQISPMLDGVTVDFEPQAATSAVPAPESAVA